MLCAAQINKKEKKIISNLIKKTISIIYNRNWIIEETWKSSSSLHFMEDFEKESDAT